MGFPCDSTDKESTCNAGDLGLIPGLGRSPGERKGYPLQYSVLENSMNYTGYEITKSWIQLRDFQLSMNLSCLISILFLIHIALTLRPHFCIDYGSINLQSLKK